MAGMVFKVPSKPFWDSVICTFAPSSQQPPPFSCFWHRARTRIPKVNNLFPNYSGARKSRAQLSQPLRFPGLLPALQIPFTVQAQDYLDGPVTPHKLFVVPGKGRYTDFLSLPAHCQGCSESLPFSYSRILINWFFFHWKSEENKYCKIISKCFTLQATQENVSANSSF